MNENESSSIVFVVFVKYNVYNRYFIENRVKFIYIIIDMLYKAVV